MTYQTIPLKTNRDIKNWYDDFFMDRGGPFTTNRRYNRDMLRFLGVNSNDSAVLLDVACGGGLLLKEIEGRIKTFGLDISMVALNKAKSHLKYSCLINSSSDAIPFPDETFDYITCLGSLEHFSNMDRALQEIHRVLKPDGKVNIYVPNLFHIAIVLYVLRCGGIPQQLQSNERLLTRLEWETILRKYFEINKIIGYNHYPRIYSLSYWQLPFEGLRKEGVKGFIRNLYHNLINIYVPFNFSFHFCFICKKEKQ